jgi:hypothetical protein
VVARQASRLVGEAVAAVWSPLQRRLRLRTQQGLAAAGRPTTATVAEALRRARASKQRGQQHERVLRRQLSIADALCGTLLALWL